jgi:hypothetical protein
MAAPRPARVRVATGAAALAVAALTAVVLAVRPSDTPASLRAIAGIGAGAVLLAALAAAAASAVAPALVLLGLEYGLSLIGRGNALDLAAPLVAALLLLVAELAWWSVDAAAPIRAEPPVLRGHVARLAALVVGSGVASVVVLMAATVPTPGWAQPVGMSAALAALIVPIALLGRSPPQAG